MPSDAARTLIDPLDGVNEEYSDIAAATELTEMPAGPTGESHSFAGVSVRRSFTDNAAQYAAGSELSAEFVDYFTQPETLNQHFPEAAPTRAAQAEMELFTNNPTGVPDSWLQTRLNQAPNATRYGITDAVRAAPFLGALEGSTLGYSTAISNIIGNDTDPKQALGSMRTISARRSTTPIILTTRSKSRPLRFLWTTHPTRFSRGSPVTGSHRSTTPTSNYSGRAKPRSGLDGDQQYRHTDTWSERPS